MAVLPLQDNEALYQCGPYRIFCTSLNLNEKKFAGKVTCKLIYMLGRCH
jgi:hypothetical protein